MLEVQLSHPQVVRALSRSHAHSRMKSLVRFVSRFVLSPTIAVAFRGCRGAARVGVAGFNVFLPFAVAGAHCIVSFIVAFRGHRRCLSRLQGPGACFVPECMLLPFAVAGAECARGNW